MMFGKRGSSGNLSPFLAMVFVLFAVCGILLIQSSTSWAGDAETATTLKIALVHYAVKHKDPKHNLEQLLMLNRKAAQEGASVIFNTELAVSGYSFQSRQDIAPFTETDQGETIRAMAQLAEEFGVYIGIPFAERDPSTQSYYNSAIVLDPRGKSVCKYRKILTERRWARAGNPLQKGVFDTPWGRMGVAICADSYNGLIARIMAIRGMNLLWVPANWPPMGGVDPKVVWRARALENGIYVAACNRTGKDKMMDCRQAISCVFDPEGNPLLCGSSEKSHVFFVEIPLDAAGRLPDDHRHKALDTRDVDIYRNIYLNPWLENLTGYYKLPDPGVLEVHCFIPKSDGIDLKDLEKTISETPKTSPTLWILPGIRTGGITKEKFAEIAGKHQVALAVSMKQGSGSPGNWLITPRDIQAFADSAEAGNLPFKILHYGPAAIAMIPIEEYRHPELAVVMSKLGTDLVVLSEEKLPEKDFLLSHIKALTGVAVAVCTPSEAEITCVKDLHGSWEQRRRNEPGSCTYSLDTSNTRKKNFQTLIDFDRLLESK